MPNFFNRGEGQVRDRAYLCPPPFTLRGGPGHSEDDMVAWVRDVCSDGSSYLKQQPAYPYIQDGLDIVNGDFNTMMLQALSNVKPELVVRNLKELVAAQTNIRIIPAFKAEDKSFRHQNEILNRSFMSWQSMTFADRAIRKGWQYATACGTGYIGTRYDGDYHWKGHGDIVLDAYGPLQVLPIGMAPDHDLQKAYAVVIKVPTPIHEAWRKFPLMRHKIKYTSKASMSKGGVITQAMRYASAALRRWGPGHAQEQEPATWEMVDIYYIYVDDDTVNNTGEVVEMGTPGTSWAYQVPYVGQPLKIRTNARGQDEYRKATPADCLLYPLRRLIKATDDCILNPNPADQSSPYWHGKVPITQLRADDWPWMFLGMPLTRQGQSLEKANTEVMRGVVDAINCRLSPTSSYDQGLASSALMDVLNTRIPNQRVPMDYTLQGGDVFKPLLPYQHYEFPAYILEYIKENEGRITHQMGVADATALARARQTPSSDSQEKLLDQMGALIKDQSRNMEAAIRGIGEQWKSNFFQFITAARRLSILGADGISEEDYDYDPGTLVPLDLAVPDTWYKQLSMQQYERARWHRGNFVFTVSPYSLHEMNSMTRKLFYMQLKRGDVIPMDWWTLSEVFDIKNFGSPPTFEDPETGEKRTAETIMDRYLCQLEIMQRLAAIQGAGGGGGQGGKGPGRKPSGHNAPTLEMKDGGARSTVRESKH